MSVLKHNSHTATWEWVEETWILQYNALASIWQYAPPGAAPRRNPYAHRWELVPPDWILQYNALNDNWQFGPRQPVSVTPSSAT